MAMKVLTLTEEVHSRVWEDGRYVRRPESHFLDYVIDGTPLRSRLARTADLVTDLNRAWGPSAVAATVEILLGRQPHPDLPAGRIPLLVCGSCGALDCGALTAQLLVLDNELRWSDWRWADHEGEHDLEVDLDGCVFDRAAYEDTIGGAGERVSRMPYDRLAHHGKRILWPWQWGWTLPRR